MEMIFTSIKIYLRIALIAIATFVASFIPSTTISEVMCINDQIERVEQLAIEYEEGTATIVNEQEFCNFDLANAQDYQVNQLQMLATHNSYKKYQPKLVYEISKNILPYFDEDSELMNYEHGTPTEQLNMGLRSFEWDLWEYDGAFDGYYIQHSPYIDSRSNIPNMKLALEEVRMWSEYNQNHMPIIILIECKEELIESSDKDGIVNSQQVVDLGNYISDILGDKLYTPSQMCGDHETMSEMRLAKDYPSISELQGKIMVLIHTGDACTDYAENVEFENQKLFITERGDDSCFTLINGAQTSKSYKQTNTDIRDGYMVRASVSTWLSPDNKLAQKYANTGANILSSDYLDQSKFDDATRIDGSYTIGVRK